MSTIRETFGLNGHLSPMTEFVGGIELEMESMDTAAYPPGWKSDEDGSLRNSGCEIISCPGNYDQLMSGFRYVHTNSKFMVDEEKFSNRTSIHVHVNCLDLTLEQTKSVLLWYAVFEPVFFALCHPSRRDNIHCVGLDQTILSEHYKKSLSALVSKWANYKYTALNLRPLSTQGTIEFRHMEGHDDAEKFAEWLRSIKNLWEYGQEHIMGKDSLGMESIKEAFKQVFGHTSLKHIGGSLTGLLSDNLLDVKLALV